MRSLFIVAMFILAFNTLKSENIELSNSDKVKLPNALLHSGEYYYLHDQFFNIVYVYDRNGKLYTKINANRTKYFYHDSSEFSNIGIEPYSKIQNIIKDINEDQIYMNVMVSKFNIEDTSKEVHLIKPMVCAKIDQQRVSKILDFNIPPEYLSGAYMVKIANQIGYQSSRRHSEKCYISTRALGYADYDCCSGYNSLDIVDCGLSVDELTNCSPYKDFHISGRFTPYNDSSFIYFVYPDLLPIKIYFDNNDFKKIPQQHFRELLESKNYAIQRIVANDEKLGIVLVKITKNKPSDYIHKNLIYLEYNGESLEFKRDVLIDISNFNVSKVFDILFVDNKLKCLAKTKDKKWKIIDLNIDP
jgi:hypothetical protein